MKTINKPVCFSIIYFAAVITMPTNALATDILFGHSGIYSNSLTLKLEDNSEVTLSTADSMFDAGIFNQGWWTFDQDLLDSSASDDNDNYAAGGKSNNFFTFDISSVDINNSVVDAIFNIRRATGISDSGYTYFEYNMYDVLTDAATLNNNSTLNQGIFDDLGSGVHYGQFDITVAGDPGEILLLQMNQDLISDINTAIDNENQYFSIGGHRSKVGAAIPEPTSLMLLGLGLAGFIFPGKSKKT